MSLISVRNSKKYNFTKNDYIYYNVNIYNDKDDDLEAKFNATRVENILDNPSDYELAIVRFSVPTINIPIFILDSNKKFTHSLRYKGKEYTEPITWISNTNEPNKQGYIWNFQEFIDSLNLALSKLYNSIRIDYPVDPVVADNAYWTISNDASNLVNFNVPDIQISNPDKVELYMNKELQAFLPTISYIVDASQGEVYDFYYKIVIANNFNNVENNIITMYSESSPLFLWSDFKTIVFLSSSIPVVPEYIGGTNQVSRRVLTDFEPQDALFDRSSIQFFPQGPLRYYNLKSTQPLDTIDLQIYWQDKIGRLFPINLAKYDSATVKIEFRHKKARGADMDNDM